MSATRRSSDAALARRAAIRLGVQASVVVAVLVVALTAVAVFVIVDQQRAQAAASLGEVVARADDVEDPPPSMYLVVRTADGRVERSAGLPPGIEDPIALDAAAAGAQQPTTERDSAGVDYAITSVRRADGVTVQAILDLTTNHANRDDLLRTMLVTGAAGLLLAAAVGTWLGTRALAPLSAALSLQRRFVADAGHELRTPLTLLNTRAQLLRRRLRRDTSADPDALVEADGVVADSGRLTTILEDLLLAADPFAERPREQVDLVAVCRDAVEAATADARVREIDLRVEVGAAVPVSGSAPALRRAVTALVDNAVRHARCAVVVSAASDGGGSGAVVEVRDDGDGVDPATVPRLFDRFASGDRRRTPGPGTPRRYGLGLAMVAEIAAAHHGRVELARPDPAIPGAAFRLVVPAAGPAGKSPRKL